MTKKQRIFLMADLWPAACRAQGWDAQDRDLRLQVLSEAVGRTVGSAAELGAAADFDAVKGRCLALAGNVQGALEESDPSVGLARRLRQRILETVRCLNLYGAGEAVARRIIADGTHHAGIEREAFDRMPLPRILEGLPARGRLVRDRNGRLREGVSPLMQVLRTLSRELNGRRGWRARAGDSLHAMRLKAGLECHCRDCAPAGGSAAVEDEAVEEPF